MAARKPKRKRRTYHGDDGPPWLKLLGAHLRELRLREGFSQKDLAEKLGVCATNLCNVEYGRRPPSRAIADWILKVHSIPLELPKDSPPWTVDVEGSRWSTDLVEQILTTVVRCNHVHKKSGKIEIPLLIPGCKVSLLVYPPEVGKKTVGAGKRVPARKTIEDEMAYQALKDIAVLKKGQRRPRGKRKWGPGKPAVGG